MHPSELLGQTTKRNGILERISFAIAARFSLIHRRGCQITVSVRQTAWQGIDYPP